MFWPETKSRSGSAAPAVTSCFTLVWSVGEGGDWVFGVKFIDDWSLSLVVPHLVPGCYVGCPGLGWEFLRYLMLS